MELQTISQVSRDYGISTRMLRYYEQARLIQSLRKDDYAYRIYDENAVSRLRQIIVLRKLRIPVKQIISILNNSDNQINERSENLSMEELNKANEELMKLDDKDVRIIYLPPMIVAAAYASGEGCEGKALDMISKFTKESELLKIKPDARSFGFDCSGGATGIGENSHVYEVWVSVPDNMEISEPLVRREFSGGLYAAHVLRAWDFQDWRRLNEWVNASEKYNNDWGSPRWESPETVYGQGLEETLNFYNYIQKYNSEMSYLQLDLLFPIKENERV